jgi:Uma2 family endonuclease
MAAHLSSADAGLDRIDTSRFECVDGRLTERPMPNERHAELQKNVLFALDRQARALGMKVLPEWTVNRSAESKQDWLTPDVTVSLPESPRSKSGNVVPPLFLAVEILSPGQTMTGMIRKAKLYLDWGVRYVWLIDPDGIAFAMSAGSNSATWADETGQLEAGALHVSMNEILSTPA